MELVSPNPPTSSVTNVDDRAPCMSAPRVARYPPIDLIGCSTSRPAAQRTDDYLLTFLDHSHHDNGESTQTTPPCFRDCDPRDVRRTAVACIRDGDLVIRGQKGELDVISALARPDEAVYTWPSSEVCKPSGAGESLTSFTGSDFLAHRSRTIPPSMVQAESGFLPFQTIS